MSDQDGPAKIKKRVIAASSDEDDEPLIKRARLVSPQPQPQAAQTNGHTKRDSSEEGAPLMQQLSAAVNANANKAESSEDEKEVPLAAAKPPVKRKKAPVKREGSGSESEASSLPPPKPRKKPLPKRPKLEEDKPAPRKPKAAAAKAKAAAVKKEDEEQSDVGSAAVKDDDEGDEAERAWWDKENDDNSIKWTTLSHHGVLFPPPYQRLPSTVKLLYDGRPVELSEEAEEVAGFFAAMMDTDHAAKPVFVDNFFADFRAVVDEHPCPDGTDIVDFAKCDFRPMNLHFEAEKARKKAMTRAEKKAEKDAREALEAPYKDVLLDGKVEKMGNFRVEPPGLFRGRGAHPKTGKLKTRVQPEQIVINIGADAEVPKPPEGHQWGKVQHDNTVSWLAMWKENINNAFKYVFLAAGSSLKGKSDFLKFEKARKLQHHIDQIRMDYTKDLKDKLMLTRQRATAVYLIDKFALRAGNEKGDDEADTVGCCSLKCDNITLTPPTEVLFDFLGKDSIRFLNTFNVEVAVFTNLRIFKKGKVGEDLLFDRLNTGILNSYLRSYMDGLSAKVFRTYNASWTFQQELDKRTDPEASVADKVLAYNRANRDVAILCNHQRSVSKTHDAAMTKLADKLKALKYQRRKLRWALASATSRDADDKTYEEYEDEESDLDDEWVAQHELGLRDKAKETARKKFDKFKEEEASASATVTEAAPSQSPSKLKPAKKEDEDEDDSDAPMASKGKAKPKKGKARPKAESGDEEEDKKPAKKKKVFTEEDLEAALEQADKDYEKNRAETESMEVDTRKSVAQILRELGKKDLQIAAHRNTMVDRDEGKEVSLGTSKINYIDPRLTFAWCKKYDVPVEKLFSKTLREKFTWAANVGADWRF